MTEKKTIDKFLPKWYVVSGIFDQWKRGIRKTYTVADTFVSKMVYSLIYYGS